MAKLIVQFMHPGGEQIIRNSIPKKEIIAPKMPWNYKGHRRKFICQPGAYIDDNGCVVNSEKIYFWGEWESESLFYNVTSSSINGPVYCHCELIVNKVATYKPIPPKTCFLQNTDPYVFGDSFKYAICQQRGKLKTLDKGSIIMFGSHLGGKFVLDTVFVVAGWIDYEISRKKLTISNSSLLTQTYIDVVLDPYARSITKASHRIYFGATPTNSVDGMYSFVPCSLTGQFARPIVCHSIIPVSDKLTQRYKIIDETCSQKIWRDLVGITKAAELKLGVFIKEPTPSAFGHAFR